MSSREGTVTLRISGPKAFDLFQHEPGGHRWQRVPPNDKRGRVQTSTVTVTVLPEGTAVAFDLNPADLHWAYSRGSGPGGQKRNKTESAVDLTHVPTGVVVHCETERSQSQNKALALEMLRSRLATAHEERNKRQRDGVRREQVGTGARGDKVVTVGMQDGVVMWHDFGQKQSLKNYLAGETPIFNR